jgi:hypothetical protein
LALIADFKLVVEYYLIKYSKEAIINNQKFQFIIAFIYSKMSLHFCKDCGIFCEGVKESIINAIQRNNIPLLAFSLNLAFGCNLAFGLIMAFGHNLAFDLFMAFGLNLAFGRNLVFCHNLAFGLTMAFGLIMAFCRNLAFSLITAFGHNLAFGITMAFGLIMVFGLFSFGLSALAALRLIGFSGLGLVGLVDFIGHLIGLDGLIGLMGLIIHNGLTSLIGLIGFIGLIGPIGYNGLGGFIGLGIISLISFMGLIGIHISLGHNGLIGFIGLGLIGFIGLGLVRLVGLICHIIGLNGLNGFSLVGLSGSSDIMGLISLGGLIRNISLVGLGCFSGWLTCARKRCGTPTTMTCYKIVFAAAILAAAAKTHGVAIKLTSANKIINAAIWYYYAAYQYYAHLFVRESWLSHVLFRLDSLFSLFFRVALQNAEHLLSTRLPQLTKYCDVRECENILHGYLYVFYLAFVILKGIFIF